MLGVLLQLHRCDDFHTTNAAQWRFESLDFPAVKTPGPSVLWGP